MESYIIRIYRKEQQQSEKMTGVVIQVGGSEETVFSNVFELYKILNKKNKTDQYVKNQYEL